MEDLKKIQEFFSKPLEENVDKKYSDFLIALRDSGVTNMFGAAPYLQAEFGLDKREAREVLANWMRSFGESLNENVFVEAFKLEKALKGMGYDVKVKYLDDFGKDVFEIYFNNPEDADDDSIFYDVKKLGYDNVRVFANPQESLDEAYIVTYAKNKGEKPASAAYKLRGSALAFMRDLEKDGYITMLTQKPVDGVDETLDEYNTGLYYDPAKERNAPKTKDAAKSGMERVKDMLKKIMKEEEGYSKFLKTDDNPEGKTQGLDTKTMNKILMNVIKDLDETIQLGKNLEEGKLCPKGEAYRKRRMAAGEKSSAYLSGRAVKVCKGQMSGKKKK